MKTCFVLAVLLLSTGCNSKSRFVHVGGANAYIMFDNQTAQNCYSGPNDPPANMPTCKSLADGTYVKPNPIDVALGADDKAPAAKAPCPAGVPSGTTAGQLSRDELADVVGREADFNGTYVKYTIANNTTKCITAFTASFEFQTKSGEKSVLTTTQQISDTLSPSWFQTGFSFYVLDSVTKHYSLDDSRYYQDGQVDYNSPKFPVSLTSWHVIAAWGFAPPK